MSTGNETFIPSEQFTQAAAREAARHGINTGNESEVAGQPASGVVLETGILDASGEPLHQNGPDDKDENLFVEEPEAQAVPPVMPTPPGVVTRALCSMRRGARNTSRFAGNVWRSNGRIRAACEAAGLKTYGFGPLIVAFPKT